MKMTVRIARVFFAAASLWMLAAPLLFAESGNKKQPVPSEAAQAEAMKIVKEVFGSEYAKAESLAAKQALGKTLLEKARDTHDDMAGKFVLLKLSRDISTQGLDGLAAFRAVDVMAETFEIDPVEMKAAVLKYGAVHAKLGQHHKRLMEGALSLVDAAVAEDNYSVAKRLCDFAASEAPLANEPAARSLAAKRGAEVEEILAVLYEKAQTATAMLSADPVNPQANAAVGKYLCFAKGDWDRGVLMLALGSASDLKAMAEKELDELSPMRPEQVGDGWWEIANKEDGVIKNQIQGRAAFWYRKALPGLSGLMKDRVAKRLDSLAQEHPSAGVIEQPVPRNQSVPEHTTWRVPNNWSEQVQRWRTVIEYTPGGGHKSSQVPYTDTVHHYGAKTVQAKLVGYDQKTGIVVLKIAGENGGKESEQRFRYAALGKEDKKYLDSIRKQAPN